MNRCLLTLSSLIFLSASLNAQESAKGTVKFGLKTGLNFSVFSSPVGPFKKTSAYYDESYKSYLRISGLAGVTADYQLSGRTSLNAEVLYNARGMAYRKESSGGYIPEFDGQGHPVKSYSYFKFDIDYVEVPLSLAYNFLPATSDTWFNGYAGIAPGIAVVKKINPAVIAGTWSLPVDAKGNLENVNSFNASLIAGMQLGQYHWAAAGFYADLRVSYTLLAVFKEQDVDELGNGFDTKMLTGTLGFGVKF